MTTEREFMTGIAEIILSVFDDPELRLTRTAFCKDGHFSPRMLTPERLLTMKSNTLMRLLLYLATMMDARQYRNFTEKLCRYVFYVATHDEFSAYDIIDNHAGSPLKRR